MKAVHIVVGEWGDYRSIDRVFSNYKTALEWAEYRRRYTNRTNEEELVIYSVESYPLDKVTPDYSVRKGLKQALSEVTVSGSH